LKIVRFRVHGGTEPRSGELDGEVLYSGGQRFGLEDVSLLAPCVPTKIVCVGRNYADHAKEMGGDVPTRPLLFFKPPSAVIGPDEAIVLPPSGEIHYEAELAVVIGRPCRCVPEEKAMDVVLGYTCLNDVTNRTAQAWETNWVRAKGFDTSAPIGPWIVLREDVEGPFHVALRLNGEVRQEGWTSSFIFGIPALIATITSTMTLEPGDVIATGTPAGVGPLRPGDTVEVEIDGIGCLRNPVRAMRVGEGPA